MPLTQQQQSAVDNITAWYMGTSAPSFTLIGAAGTGKTYTVGYILNKLPGIKVALSPTNKAKSVLEGVFQSQGININVRTIHAALGYSVSQTKGRYKVKGQRVVNDSTSSVNLVRDSMIDPETDLIIVDETSMVDINIEKELLKLAKGIGARILWLGDNYQLKPPGKIQCSAFKNVNKSILTDVVRYSGGALRIATELRRIIDNNSPKPSLEELVSYQEELEEELQNVHLLDKREWYKQLKQDVVSNGDFTVLAFKNDKVVEHNGIIRDFRGRTRELEVGDKLIALKPVRFDNYRRNKHVPKFKNKFNNGEMVSIDSNDRGMLKIVDCFSKFTYDEIEDMTIEPEQFIKNLWGNTESKEIKKPCRVVVMSSEDSPKRNSVQLEFYDPDNLTDSATALNEVQDIVSKLELYVDIMYGINDYSKAFLQTIAGDYNNKDTIALGEKAGREAIKTKGVVVREAVVDIFTYLIKEYGQNAATVFYRANDSLKTTYVLLMKWKQLNFLTYHWNYADAITVHKSQGSTFNDVFIDGCDIMKAPGWKNLMYVALTRAQGNVYILK